MILNKHLYVRASDVGRIIAGCDLGTFPRESLESVSQVLRALCSELVDDGMSLAAFAAVEECTGETLVDQELLELANPIERNAYLERSLKGNVLEEAYIGELRRQFEGNNVAGRYADSGYRVAPAICSYLDQERRLGALKKLEDNLYQMLRCISSYKGSPEALDEVMVVLCKYVCMLRFELEELPVGWIDCIRAIDEGRYASGYSGFLSFYDGSCWRVRVRALQTAAGIGDGMAYLVDGVVLGSLSTIAKVAYLESLEWLITSSVIDDGCALLVRRICEEAARLDEMQARKKVARCLAACSKRWGSEDVSDTISSLTRDPDDEVVYQVLLLCKEGAFGDSDLEKRTIDLLTRDTNWFIRWHASKAATDDAI